MQFLQMLLVLIAVFATPILLIFIVFFSMYRNKKYEKDKIKFNKELEEAEAKYYKIGKS